MLSNKEFFEKDFFAFCQQQHDEAKNYLNTCGKPNNQVDIWNIKFNKETVSIFKGFLK